MEFCFYRMRFHFVAKGRVHFARGKAANVLRGAFGTIFRKIACAPQCVDSRVCQVRDSCVYARVFEPRASDEGPSGLADPPRPFVFRAAHLDGRTVQPGESFYFDVHLFDLQELVIGYFVQAFVQLVSEGLGPGRAQSALTSVDLLDVSGEVVRRLFDGVSLSASQIEPCSLSLEAWCRPVPRVEVSFSTPMELKADHGVVERPEFGVLLARLRDRLSILRALYGAGPLEIDFAEFGRRAEAIAMTRCEIRHKEVTRFSTRTRQSHPLGGFVGVAEYEGELREFIPYLIAGQFTGVGRQTTWGKGEISVRI